MYPLNNNTTIDTGGLPIVSKNQQPDLGGLPVIKKKVNGVGGGQVGTSVPQSVEGDPVKDLLQPIREDYANKAGNYIQLKGINGGDMQGMNQPFIATISEAKEQVNTPSQLTVAKNEHNVAANNLVNATQAVKQNIFPNGKKAKQYIETKVEKNGSLNPDNETDQLARQRSGEMDKVADDFDKSKSLVASAVNEAMQNDDNLAKQIHALNGKLPPAMEGAIVSNYLNNHRNDLEELSKDNTDLGNEYKDLRDNIETKYPDYGMTVIANKLSKEREKQGYNSSIANFNTSTFRKHNDDLASKILTPQEQELYKNNKDKVDGMIDTGGALNRLSEGVQSTLSGMGGTLKTLTGQSSQQQRLYNALNEQSTQVSNGEKGWKDVVGQTFKMGGTILPIMSGGEVLEGAGVGAGTANKISMATAFGNDMLKEGQLKYPDNPYKATASAIANTLAYTVLPDIAPAGKVKDIFKEIKPELDNVVANIGDNETALTLRNKLSNAFQKGLIQYGKGIGEMGGLAVFNQALDKTLMNDAEYQKFHPDTEVGDVVKQMAAANILPGLLGSVGELSKSKPEINEQPTEQPQPEQQQTSTRGNVEGQVPTSKVRQESIVPQSENIHTNEKYRTMDMGNDEGKDETKEARTQMKERFSNGDIPIDGENGKGETGKQFAARALSQWIDDKNNQPNNTTIVTHSSVLKAIKAYEDMKDKPDDVNNFSPEQWKEFSDNYNKESTDNGDLEIFKVGGKENTEQYNNNSDKLIGDINRKLQLSGSRYINAVDSDGGKIKIRISDHNANEKNTSSNERTISFISKNERNSNNPKINEEWIVNEDGNIVDHKGEETGETINSILKDFDIEHYYDDNKNKVYIKSLKEQLPQKQIVVIRHGQTEDNEANKFRSGNTNLTDKGIEQAKVSGRELKEKTGGDVPKIITSDLPRAIHSSNLIHSELTGEKPNELSENKNVNLQYKNVSEDANDIITGKKVFERFSPQEQRGFAEGGRPNVEASLLLSTGEGTSGEDNATPEAQENRIEQYAKDNGIWTDNTTQELTKKYGEPIARGEEAIVWHDPTNGKVIKTQDTFQYDNLQQKLDGITLHNSYFPEAPLKVIGFGRNANGEFQVIVEQPHIQGEKLTPPEIKNHLENIGFKEDENGHFSNGDTIIEDVHTGNAIKDKDGNIIVIDPIMRLNTPEQGYGGERKIANKVSEGTTEDELPFGKGDKTGISHENRQARTYDTKSQEPIRGEGVTVEQSIQHGQDLISDGKNPQDYADKFKADKEKNISYDAISAVRAQNRLNVKATDDAEEQFGENSPQHKAALDKENNWYNDVVKPMQTEWHKIGQAQQGQEDIQTGSYQGLKRAAEESRDRPLTPKEQREARGLSDRVKMLENKNEKLKQKIDELHNQGNKGEAKLTFEEGAKKAADKFREKFKTKPITFKDENGNDIPIQKMGVGWNDLIEAGAKAIELSGKIADGVKAIIDKIKDEDWYKGLSDNDKDRFAKQLTEHYGGKEDEIFSKYSGKQDYKFSPDEAKEIWNYAKENYLDKGEGFSDMVHKVGMDLGLKPQQVIDAIASPKGAKEVTDEAYRTNYERNKAVRTAQNWAKSGNKPVRNFLDTISSPFRSLATLGHGHALLFTHAAPNLFDYRSVGRFLTLAGKQFKIVYGNPQNYAKAEASLRNEPLYNTALRSGLAVDPHTIYDDWQLADKFLKKLKIQGNKGFLMLKMMRMEIFKSEYNKLSAVERADKQTLKNIAELANHWTGTAGIKPSGATNAFVFAPNLIVSKWARLTTDPIKAVSTLTNWKNASVADKAAAKMIFRKSGRIAAGYIAALAANQAMLSLTGSSQSINFTNPFKSDWMKFKTGGGKTLDLSGGMQSVSQLIVGLGALPFKGGKEVPTDYYGAKTADDALKSEVMGYFRRTLSPFGGTVYDVASHKDFEGNVLPFYNDKPRTGKEKLSLLQYGAEKLPLPLAGGIKEFHDQMVQDGVDKSMAAKVSGAFLVAALESGGIKMGNEPKASQQSPYTEQDLNDKRLKWVKSEWGMDLPNTVASSENITDEDKRTKILLSKYPKEIQDKYYKSQVSNLKDVLGDVHDNQTVWVKNYKDEQGNAKNSVKLGLTGDDVEAANKQGYDEKPLKSLNADDRAKVLSEAQKEATNRTKKQIFNQ